MSPKQAAKQEPSAETVSLGRIQELPAQSADVQALSLVASADSESVDELLEEGNAFEANVLEGVEHADSDGGREVHIHEVAEDDVPGEYLDQDG